MNIINIKQLSKTPLRKKALSIIEAGYSSIEIEKIIKERISLKGGILTVKYRNEKSEAAILGLDDFKNVYLIGIGKGSGLATLALCRILGKRLTKGIALDVIAPDSRLRIANCEFLRGDHPLPSLRNIKGTQKIMALAQKAKEDDLVIALICGGGSALACASKKELDCSSNVFKELTNAGADIIELNTVRKHISQIKGGNLAKLIYPATCISLIVSDVLGNDLSMISSGPTVYDKTTVKDAENIIKKYFPHQSVFKSASVRDLRETPKDKKYFENVKNILFVSNKTAVDAMMQKVKELNLNPKIYSIKLKGEAKNVFSKLGKNLKSGDVVLAAGESTVTFHRSIQTSHRLNTEKSQYQSVSSLYGSASLGKGGRNQEAVLGALSKITDGSIAVASFASDGHDNTEAAGVIACALTLEKAKKLNLNPEEFLNNHDSFHFFKKTGDLIFAKHNCFNVADLMLIVRE